MFKQYSSLERKKDLSIAHFVCQSNQCELWPFPSVKLGRKDSTKSNLKWAKLPCWVHFIPLGIFENWGYPMLYLDITNS